jgi:hypothetical protein
MHQGQPSDEWLSAAAWETHWVRFEVYLDRDEALAALRAPSD